jgi:hypothetical protein
MSPGRIAAVIVAFASITLFSVVGAQAETHLHKAHHRHHAAEVAAEGGAVPTSAVMTGGYYQPSEWGDFECAPSYPGCRPYASKDWSKP